MTNDSSNAHQTRNHINEERTVHCPVEDCDATPLARGVHLHVTRSVGNGHGPQGEVPDGLDLDNLETAGTKEVSMDYPEHRKTENVARLCPYCERPFRGKQGVLIHLGQTLGRKDHPSILPDDLDPDSFSIVKLDKHDNIVEVVEEADMDVLPSAKKRQSDEEREELPEKVREYIAELRAEGKDDEADRAEELLS